MKFNRIDMECWARKPYFEYYLKDSKCSYSITANLNVTNLLARLRKKNVKLYPAFIYMISTVVNSHIEFRTTFDDQKQLGYWDQMIPIYTIFHQDDHTFSVMWSEYSDDFSVFYKNYQNDIEHFGDVKGLWAKEGIPAHSFSISSIPWLSFTGFNLNLHNDGEYLLPIITGGKYFSKGKEIFLPVSLQFHHAVCDGYHASIFIKDLQKLADCCEELIF